MFYVKSNFPQYHILQGSNYGMVYYPNGTTYINVDCNVNESKRPAALCGLKVSNGSEVFKELPAGVDRGEDVCHKCARGVGIAKTSPEQAKSDPTEKIKSDLATSARDLFS